MKITRNEMDKCYHYVATKPKIIVYGILKQQITIKTQRSQEVLMREIALNISLIEILIQNHLRIHWHQWSYCFFYIDEEYDNSVSGAMVMNLVAYFVSHFTQLLCGNMKI